MKNVTKKPEKSQPKHKLEESAPLWTRCENGQLYFTYAQRPLEELLATPFGYTAKEQRRLMVVLMGLAAAGIWNGVIRYSSSVDHAKEYGWNEHCARPFIEQACRIALRQVVPLATHLATDQRTHKTAKKTKKEIAE